VVVIEVYRAAISPTRMPACRYIPSCSAYAVGAVEQFGLVRGGLLALRRLLRCHPFARGGYDPVPDCPRPTAAATAAAGVVSPRSL